MTRTPRKPAPPSSRLAIMLSAFVYPGAGQFSQGRAATAIVYAAGFTVAFVFVAIAFTRILMVYFGQAFSAHPSDQAPSAAGLLTSVGVAILVYAASLVDTIRAHTRAQRAAAERRLMGLPPPPPPA